MSKTEDRRTEIKEGRLQYMWLLFAHLHFEPLGPLWFMHVYAASHSFFYMLKMFAASAQFACILNSMFASWRNTSSCFPPFNPFDPCTAWPVPRVAAAAKGATRRPIRLQSAFCKNWRKKKGEALRMFQCEAQRESM